MSLYKLVVRIEIMFDIVVTQTWLLQSMILQTLLTSNGWVTAQVCMTRRTEPDPRGGPNW